MQIRPNKPTLLVNQYHAISLKLEQEGEVKSNRIELKIAMQTCSSCDETHNGQLNLSEICLRAFPL